MVGIRQCKYLGEIPIQCNQNPRLLYGVLKNVHVIGLAHADFPDMHGVPPFLTQETCRWRGQALIQEESFHAASI